MEYLSRCLNTLKDRPQFQYHPKCLRTKTVAIMFADDLLIFCKGNIKFVGLIKEQIDKFSATSGFVTNLDKFAVYTVGMDHILQGEIKDLLGMPIGQIPFKYLGVPLSYNKLIVSQCLPLVNRISAAIQNWTCKSLTYATRVALIKSVLIGIKGYWSQLFLLPQKIIRKIETICRIFLWSGGSGASRKAPIAWSMACAPKECGSLDIKDFMVWNQAVVVKQLWAIAVQKDHLWSRWINAYYVWNRPLLT